MRPGKEGPQLIEVEAAHPKLSLSKRLKHKICFTSEVDTSSSNWGANYPISILGEDKMRQIVIVTVAACVAVIVALVGATAMIVNVPQKAEVAAASSLIDVVQMTRDAKDLPVE